jgi:hypothetical protein
MPANAQAQIEKIEAPPAERIGEVEDVVDFIAAKTRRLTARGRALATAPALEAAGAPPTTEEEIAAEVEAFPQRQNSFRQSARRINTRRR